MRKLSITIGDNGNLVRGFGHLGPIAGDQPLAEAVKCDRAVFQKRYALGHSKSSHRISHFLGYLKQYALSSSIPPVARATAPGGARERQERSLQRRPASVTRVSTNTFQSLSVLRWNSFRSRPTSEKRWRPMAPLWDHKRGASADRLSSSEVRPRIRNLDHDVSLFGRPGPGRSLQTDPA